MKLTPVFLISAAVVVVFVLFGALSPMSLAAVVEALQRFIINRLSWYYIVAVTGFAVFVLWLLVSPYGQVRLGKDDEEPAYGNFSWFAMLFSAGMGIGLVFYGVAEPLLHYVEPPRAAPETVDAARDAIVFTFFHWGLHAWAIYIVVGLSLAYFAHRHDLPLMLRSTLYPLLGARIHGPLGGAVEIIAVFGTLFGVATSLGLGVLQINAGLEYLGVLSISTRNQVFLIAGITLIATLSVVSGLDRGVRRLSELNLLVALALALFVFFAGPSALLMRAFVQGVGDYLQEIVRLSFRTDVFRGPEWQGTWTLFYWGWWMAWSPFVGTFIARISRGRTIREFILGVLLVPSLLTFLWMVIFGDTAIWLERNGAGLAAVVHESVPEALYVTLAKLPLSTVTSVLATLVIATFFVTSSDSASLVIDIITSGGDQDPPMGKRIFWALTQGAVAAVLLLSGGLLALQTAAITTALPFSVVMIAMCVSLVRGLRAARGRRRKEARPAAAVFQEAVLSPGTAGGSP